MVEPLRDQLDAVVVFPSMPEVMRLNKVGSFTMQNLGQSKSVVSDFMKKKKKVRRAGARPVVGMIEESGEAVLAHGSSGIWSPFVALYICSLGVWIGRRGSGVLACLIAVLSGAPLRICAWHCFDPVIVVGSCVPFRLRVILSPHGPSRPVAACLGRFQEDGSSFEEGMLKLLRTLPKVLKYLPSDKAKDARNFMMSFQVSVAAAVITVFLCFC